MVAQPRQQFVNTQGNLHRKLSREKKALTHVPKPPPHTFPHSIGEGIFPGLRPLVNSRDLINIFPRRCSCMQSLRYVECCEEFGMQFSEKMYKILTNLSNHASPLNISRYYDILKLSIIQLYIASKFCKWWPFTTGISHHGPIDRITFLFVFSQYKTVKNQAPPLNLLYLEWLHGDAWLLTMEP